MKKVLNIVLLFILGLGLISCDRMLKDSIDAWFGDIIFKDTDVTVKSGLATTEGALQFANIKFKVDDKDVSRQGELLKNLKSGTRKINVEITNSYNDGEGKAVLAGEKSVAVGANQSVAVGNFELTSEKIYGSITATTTGLTIVGPVTEGSSPLEPAKAQFKIGTTIKKFGEKFKDLETDKEVTITVEVPSVDGKTIYFTELKRTLTEAKLLTLANITLDKAKSATNAYKFIFNPADYGITTENANAIKEVHLVGKLPLSDWKPLETNYPLIKQSNGTWTGIFEIPADTEFKFIFDPIEDPNDDDKKWANGKGYEDHKDKDTLKATYPALAYTNYKVIEIPNIITQNF